MQTTNTVTLHSLGFLCKRTYLYAAIFIIGNIIFPQLCHLLPQGGLRFLPIYFFTLIGAYKYGWKVGMLTAIISPIANHILFAMPSAAMLPIIIVKSTTLTLSASIAAKYFRHAKLFIIALVVIFYQLIGGFLEAIITGSITAPLQDIILGYPGLLLQIFAGWILINHIRD